MEFIKTVNCTAYTLSVYKYYHTYVRSEMLHGMESMPNLDLVLVPILGVFPRIYIVLSVSGVFVSR